MNKTERQAKYAELKYGHINIAIHCPHCQTDNSVRTQSKKAKHGVSGGKATGAVLTGGASLLLTGLSRKQKVTEAHCDNCRITWII